MYAIIDSDIFYLEYFLRSFNLTINFAEKKDGIQEVACFAQSKEVGNGDLKTPNYNPGCLMTISQFFYYPDSFRT